jgi:uncharacterized protein (TIGR03435 family)
MRLIVIAAIIVLGVAQPSAQEPSFEVASVKVRKEQGFFIGGHGFLPSGQVRFEAAPLWYLLMHAFEVPTEVSGLRFAWAPGLEKFEHSPSFEIVAQGTPGGDTKAMLRTLLRERFGLKYHRETRQIPLYALTVKEPGKLGRWLTPTPHNCREYFARGGRKNDADAPTHPGVTSLCWPGRVIRNEQAVSVSAGPIQDLILRVLMSAIRAPVIDATGLTGNYVWQVTSARASIFASLEDELGLKLERRTGPWEVIVIDDVKMPTPN